MVPPLTHLIIRFNNFGAGCGVAPYFPKFMKFKSSSNYSFKKRPIGLSKTNVEKLDPVGYNQLGSTVNPHVLVVMTYSSSKWELSNSN